MIRKTDIMREGNIEYFKSGCVWHTELICSREYPLSIATGLTREEAMENLIKKLPSTLKYYEEELKRITISINKKINIIKEEMHKNKLGQNVFE